MGMTVLFQVSEQSCQERHKAWRGQLGQTLSFAELDQVKCFGVETFLGFQNLYFIFVGAAGAGQGERKSRYLEAMANPDEKDRRVFVSS
jgi:hypothetical protein